MFVNGQNMEVKLQIVVERGLKIVAQTLVQKRYKLRQKIVLLSWKKSCVLVKNKSIMRSAVPLHCLFDVVKLQRVAGQRP